MITEYTQTDYIDGTRVPVCLTKATAFWPIAFFVAIIGAFFVVPLFVLVVLYTVIAAHLMADPGTSCTDSACNQRARRQVVLMLATVVLSFFVCLLPFRVFTMWIILGPDRTILDIGLQHYYVILYASRVMVYLNSAVNPILYNLMSSKFRRGFCKLCRCGPVAAAAAGPAASCGYGCCLCCCCYYCGDDDDDDDAAGGYGRRRRRRGRRRGDVFRLRSTGTLTTTLSQSCNGPPPASNGSARGAHRAAAVTTVAAAAAAASVVTTLLGRHRARTRLARAGDRRGRGGGGDDDDDHLKESFV